MGSRRLCVSLLLVLTYPQLAEAQQCGFGENVVENITLCCDRIKQETMDACLEYSFYGFAEATCRMWIARTDMACRSSCANCVTMGNMLLNQCRFSMQVVAASLGDYSLPEAWCQDTVKQFTELRCPGACHAKQLQHCENATGLECMKECGNYHKPLTPGLPLDPFDGGCLCRYNRGNSKNPYMCHGDTILEGPIAGPGSANHSCELTPQRCQHNDPRGTCGFYRNCLTDYCIVWDIKCVTDNECADISYCNPRDGNCYFSSRPQGHPCNDEVSYTVNDTCTGNGICVGIIDYCLYYGVKCEPLSQCLTSGICHPHNGRCTFTQLADGTRCDDLRANTVDDKCKQGLCLGREVDLCVEFDVTCFSPASICSKAGVCDPATGQCSPPVPLTGNPCNDGDPDTGNDTCVNGVCLADFAGGPDFAAFQTLGEGSCSDREGKTLPHYMGDVKDEKTCEEVCRYDPQCVAFAFAFPLCSIYGKVRVDAPADRAWYSQSASMPPATAVEQAWPPRPGQRAGVCRLKGAKSDLVRADTVWRVAADLIFSPATLAVFFLFLFCCFLEILFVRQAFRCLRRCCRRCRQRCKRCCRRRDEDDYDDEVLAKPPPPVEALKDGQVGKDAKKRSWSKWRQEDDDAPTATQTVEVRPNPEDDALRAAGDATGEVPLPESPRGSAGMVAAAPPSQEPPLAPLAPPDDLPAGDPPSVRTPEPPSAEDLPVLPALFAEGKSQAAPT